MTIRLQFDRIPPGAEIGPHRHGVETVVYVASGEVVFEHGEAMDRRVAVGAGDVLYEAPAELHLVRNEGTVDALALLAAVEPDPRHLGTMLRRWEEDEEPVRRWMAAREEKGDGIHRRFIVERADFGSATFAFTEFELEPGVGQEWHRHPSSEHALVVFEGRGEITVGMIGETLQPLTGIRIEPGLAHRVVNTGRAPLRYYVCATPAADPTVDREPADAPPRRLDA